MLQISLVMPSWLLEYIPPLFFLSLYPFQWPSLFAMYVGGTYQVAAGFLFSGNVLDVWKATWSDLRDTTCRRFIISFALLLKVFVCSRVCHLGVQGEQKRIEEACGHGLSPCFLPLFSSGLIADTSGVCSVCPCFLKWRNAGWGHTDRSSVTASERSVRGISSMGGVGGGVNSFGLILICEILSDLVMSCTFAQSLRTLEYCIGGYMGQMLCWGIQKGRGMGENLSCVHDYCCSLGSLWSWYCVCLSQRGSVVK